MAKTKTAPEAETTESCGSCRYNIRRRCRRHAPAPMSVEMLAHALGRSREELGLVVAWPIVLGSDWCGEYHPKEATR